MKQGNTLVINTGSTSIKFVVFDENENELTRGQVEHVQNYSEAFKIILRQIINLGEINLVGHRVVHGGLNFTTPVIITEANLAELKSLSKLAPLHNPFNIQGIESCISFLPEATQIAVFDTGFYSEMPELARSYPLADNIITNHSYYRFGFHGLSHEYIFSQALKELGLNKDKGSIISLHLGGGCSITATKNGKPIETSMGYSPNEGLIMMSRTGDIDPSLVLDLISDLPGEINENKINIVRNLLNHESGIKGMTGLDDFKELLRGVSLGQKIPTKAFQLFIHRIIKYIGSYYALLEGKVDAIILTGSIGSGNPLTKEVLTNKLRFLNIPILAIKTNEEYMIMKKINELLSR